MMAEAPPSERRQLRELSPDKIRRNPDNPRLFFRSEELETLTASIRRYGIQVPITVYADKDHYVLIDGERRWRCASKLNIPKIPALVQAKPSQLENILLMFNIHALREQWDYLTIANKLPAVIELFKEREGREPNEAELSEITGLTRGQVRRCKFLFDLPRSYRTMLEAELAKPKNLQVLSEDFFIEMERALKTVRTRLPAAIPDVNAARDVLIEKFKSKVIRNITDFRKLSKIATSIANFEIPERKARGAVVEVFTSGNGKSIDDVFSAQFETRYDQRRLGLNIDSVISYLRYLEETDSEDILPDLKTRLRLLADEIYRILR